MVIKQHGGWTRLGEVNTLIIILLPNLSLIRLLKVTSKIQHLWSESLSNGELKRTRELGHGLKVHSVNRDLLHFVQWTKFFFEINLRTRLKELHFKEKLYKLYYLVTDL